MSERSHSLIPVTVLTGFLGSGKSTILKRLLDQPGMANTAVIVNEFGEIGLDHLLVAEGEENIVLLDSGCLCCTIANSLGETLSNLYFRRVRGELPAFERVVIETTGLADPAPILHTLMADGFVTRHYQLEGAVVTVDGLHGLEQLDAHEEAVKQAAVADRILLTKNDIAPAKRIAATKEHLRALNPGAPIREVIYGKVAPEEVVAVGLFDPERKSANVKRWLQDEAYTGGNGSRGHVHRHDINRHDARIQAFCAYFDFPVSWTGYAAWTSLMRRYKSENLLRVKGLVRIGEAPYVVQAVQHVFAEPMRLARWPDDDPRSRLVFITRDEDRALIDASFAALRGEESGAAKNSKDGAEGRWARRGQ